MTIARFKRFQCVERTINEAKITRQRPDRPRRDCREITVTMKRFLVFLAGFAVGTLLLYAAQGIRWTWHGQSILTVQDGGATLELGLRDDGVVIGREISASTNSPAERSSGLFYFDVPQATPIPLPWRFEDGTLILTNRVWITNEYLVQ